MALGRHHTPMPAGGDNPISSLSGTGPKAGGPLYIGRLVQKAPVPPQHSSVHIDPALADFAVWLSGKGRTDDAEATRELGSLSAVGLQKELAGPVGERNVYALHPRGHVLLAPVSERGLYSQIAAALATGNQLVIDETSGLRSTLSNLPASVAHRINWTSDWNKDGPFASALVEDDAQRVMKVNQAIAALDGPLVLVQSATTAEIENDIEAYCLNWLVEEVSTSINTAAAGGNASLMTIG
jgi:RHH-type transcriptional regulator, proline utilization regulon repressor / proline dehydrogenase / delta 1-pyrroline-5-carboxylate dehydrogenase